MKRNNTKDNGLIIFEYDNFCMIPIHLNNIYFADNIGNRASDIIEAEDDIAMKIIVYLNNVATDKIIIFDMRRIIAQKRFMQTVLSNHNRVFYNVDDKIISSIKNEENSNLSNISIDRDIVYSKIIGEYKRSSIETMIINCLNNEWSSILICNAIKKQEGDRQYYLYSSNLYANQYIKIKDVFLDPKSTYILIYYLADLLLSKENIDADSFLYDIDKSDKEFCLISASETGSILVNLVFNMISKIAFNEQSQLLKKTIHMIDLGPKLLGVEKYIDKSIFKKYRFIYIYDFLCLGSEFRRLELLLQEHGAEIVSSFGIAFYKKPKEIDEKEPLKNIYGLIDVDKWTGENKYELYL